LDTLRAFLRARIATGKRRATLELNVSALAMVQALVGLSWPLDTMAGKLMWRRIRRSLPTRLRQKRGLSIDDIERMLAPLDPAVPRDARDGALIPVAYETQLRRSNVVALTVQQVRWKRDYTATVLIQKSKEGQEGQGCVKALSAGTTRRLRHWLSIAGLTEGPLFRSTPRSKQPYPLRYLAVRSRRGPDL
jgi:integrase